MTATAVETLGFALETLILAAVYARHSRAAENPRIVSVAMARLGGKKTREGPMIRERKKNVKNNAKRSGRGNLKKSQPAQGMSHSRCPIRFDATLHKVRGGGILRLPGAASKKLPSRGQVAVRATINGYAFQTVLEPDGDFGHWMRVDGRLQKAAGAGPGDTATVEVEPTKEWPEPSVPPDLRSALSDAPRETRDLWQAITPMARWEWVRWVNATKNPNTRKRRVEVSVSKLSRGKRRPCCFNLAACTDPELSKSGKLVLE